LAFLENLESISSAQAASNAHCLRDSIDIAVSNLLLTYLVFFNDCTLVVNVMQ